MSLAASTRKLVNFNNNLFLLFSSHSKKNFLESHFVEYETSYIIESINLAQKFNIDCEIAVDSRAVQRLGALTTLPLALENPCIIFDPSELEGVLL